MDATTQSPASGADQIAALRAELDQKDATIDLLARQLEEAANRLDWISRCGSDRDPQASAKADGHAGPAMQGETADRLSHFLDQWEQVELGDSLERIDRRLSHVFELLKSIEPGSPGATRSSGSSSSRHSDSARHAESSRHAESAQEAPSGSLLTAFLLAQNGDSHDNKPQPEAAPAAAPPAAPHEEPAAHDVCFLPLPDFVVPAPVDLQTAGVEVLRSAVIARDECIQQLIARGRIAEANRTSSPDWKSLESVPEELHKRLLQLELDLRQTIKQEELSGSIERAKNSRERAQLEQVRRELESQIRRLGDMPKADPAPDAPADKSGGKRWGKVFGR